MEDHLTVLDSLTRIYSNENIDAEIFIIKGRLWTKQGLFRSAIKSYQQAYEIREREQDTAKMGYVLQVMGKAFRHQKRYKESIPFLKQSLTYKEVVNKKDPHITLGMLADSYFNMDSMDLAKKHLKDALAFSSGKRNLRSYYQYKMLESRIACKEEKLSQCLEHANEAYNGLVNGGGSKVEINESKLNLAAAYFDLGGYDKSLFYAKEGLHDAKENDDLGFITEALKLISKNYEEVKDFKQALEYNDQFLLSKEKLFKEEELRRNLDFSREWALKEKEKELTLLKNQSASQALLISQTQKTNYLLISLLGILLVMAIAIYIIFRYRAGIKNALHEKRIIEQKSIADKQRVESLILGQEMERNRIAKELHDGLGGMLSIGSLKITQNEVTIKEIHKIIDDSCEELRRVSLNLMPVSLEFLGLKSALEDLVGLEIYSDLNITLEMNDAINLAKDKEIHIYRIIQELLNNCRKHSRADEVLVQVMNGDDISIIYEDDGVGFNINEEHEGNGLKNIKNRVKFLNGSINIDSNMNGGTFINIGLP